MRNRVDARGVQRLADRNHPPPGPARLPAGNRREPIHRTRSQAMDKTSPGTPGRRPGTPADDSHRRAENVDLTCNYGETFPEWLAKVSREKCISETTAWSYCSPSLSSWAISLSSFCCADWCGCGLPTRRLPLPRRSQARRPGRLRRLPRDRGAGETCSVPEATPRHDTLLLPLSAYQAS